MSIKFKSGDMFSSDAEAIVNTVNCVGVMGKGVALEFKKRWPDNYRLYKKACDEKLLRPGKVLVFDRGGLIGGESPRYLVNFPTKDHWRSKSKIKFIEDGLDDLIDQIARLEIASIALPPLGCGNGGLDWDQVREIMISKLQDLSGVRFDIYGPSPEYSAPEYLGVGAKMTFERALYIKSIASLEDRFGGAIDRLSLQKIAYFVQEFGIKLNLKFEDALYGPYSDSLKSVFSKFSEWRYISGFSNSGKCASVTKSGFAAAEEFLDGRVEGDIVVKKLTHLFQGYDSPYGLELLATVHFYAKSCGLDVDGLVKKIHSFGSYRRNSFLRPEIVEAHQRLVEDGLL